MSARILVVDDIDANVRLLEAKLTADYYEVLTATDGVTGLAIAAAEQPDIILLDVMMPDLDGPATFLQLQAGPSTRHIPVILLTAKNLDPATDQLARDVVAIIPKPFDPMRLAGQIAAALDWAA